jgi:excisionase family DNA binding protein
MEWWTIEQVAEYLGVTPLTVTRWTTGKDFPAHHITSKIVRYLRTEIDEWIAQHN